MLILVFRACNAQSTASDGETIPTSHYIARESETLLTGPKESLPSAPAGRWERDTQQDKKIRGRKHSLVALPPETWLRLDSGHSLSCLLPHMEIW